MCKKRGHHIHIWVCPCLSSVCVFLSTTSLGLDEENLDKGEDEACGSGEGSKALDSQS